MKYAHILPLPLPLPLLLLLLLLLPPSCDQPQTQQSSASIFSPPSTAHRPPSTVSKINGLTFVAPPEPFPVNPMPAVQAVGAS
ncbi:MAG TPA: hypothetical protein PK228_12485, partial [Saprospiraceae bacterium]|nr:hypothetical protein [Saprospiraceae bacterium]